MPGAGVGAVQRARGTPAWFGPVVAGNPVFPATTCARELEGSPAVDDPAATRMPRALVEACTLLRLY